mmetsp:Transcript_3623/g.5084  ORF Transcript_3623/g.5084 Transcript_3623/m.5084 type:complete len:205 (-) Transcript_3623:471-1085(-)
MEVRNASVDTVNFPQESSRSKTSAGQSVRASMEMVNVPFKASPLTISSAADYIPPISFLVSRMTIIIKSILEQVPCNYERWKHRVNKELANNPHFRNINNLLRDFHNSEETFNIKALDFPVNVQCCTSVGGTKSMRCYKFVISKCVIREPLCDPCRVEQTNINQKRKRKLRGEGDRTQINSSVNISVLTPGSRKKRTRRARKKR